MKDQSESARRVSVITESEKLSRVCVHVYGAHTFYFLAIANQSGNLRSILCFQKQKVPGTCTFFLNLDLEFKYFAHS